MKRSSLSRTPMTKPTRGFWTCQRKQAGVKCGVVNANRKKKCEGCGKHKWKKSKPKHMQVLQIMSYEEFVEINGGAERCGICGGVGKTRRLHRDHDHDSGAPRGLLCFRCNTALPKRVDAEWLRAAAEYLERTTEAMPGGIAEDMCRRILVGQGSDTYDPLCSLPYGHEGVCHA